MRILCYLVNSNSNIGRYMHENKIPHSIDNEILNSFDMACDSEMGDEQDLSESRSHFSRHERETEFKELDFDLDRCNPIMFYGSH